jgi:hypothetical protein
MKHRSRGEQAVVAQLMWLHGRLELNPDSAAALINFMRRTDWSSVSYAVRLILLHEGNQMIVRLRERAGLPPLDDPLPGQPDNVFRRVQQMLIAPSNPF